MGNITNQIIVRDFFKAILSIASKNTSSNYCSVALNHVKKNLIAEFKFFDEIAIQGKSVIVDEKINKIDGKDVGRLFKKVIEMIGPDFLGNLLARRLDAEERAYLEKLNVKFN